MKFSAFFFCAAATVLCAQTGLASEVFFDFEGKKLQATLNDNDAARELTKRLPLAIAWENLGTSERIAYLQWKLKTGKAPKKFDAKKGDLAYFILRKNITVFYEDKPNAEYYVPLGHVSDEAYREIWLSESRQMTIRK